MFDGQIDNVKFHRWLRNVSHSNPPHTNYTHHSLSSIYYAYLSVASVKVQLLLRRKAYTYWQWAQLMTF
jgi:hypothetical protein